MSYSAYDSHGFITDIASNAGWTDFVRAVKSQDKMPSLFNLVIVGWSDNLSQLRADLQQFRSPDSSAGDIRAHLLAASKSATDIIIISDGVG
jgi:hypothetical protein